MAEVDTGDQALTQGAQLQHFVQIPQLVDLSHGLRAQGDVPEACSVTGGDDLPQGRSGGLQGLLPAALHQRPGVDHHPLRSHPGGRQTGPRDIADGLFQGLRVRVGQVDKVRCVEGQGDPRLHHQHQNMVRQIRQLIDRLLVIPVLGRDDNLGALLAHLFQNLVQALFKQVGGIGALRPLGPALLQQAVEPLIAELLVHVISPPLQRIPLRRSRSRCPGGRPAPPSAPGSGGRPGHSRPAAPQCAGNCRWFPP